MGIANTVTKLALVGTAAWLFAAGASAQADPEGGDVGASGSGSISAGGQFGGSVPTPPPTTEPAAEPTVEDTATSGTSDHDAVVGRLGVGFFGVQTLPLGDPDPMPPVIDTLSAPTIGARYWLSADLGVEAALGLAIGSGTLSPPAGGDTSTSSFGLALHGGVPIALAHTGHFVFEVVPVLNFGISSGSIETPAGAGMTATTDVSGMLFEIGGKVGAEIHFGFIDLPDLSLQGTLGLTVRYESRSVDPPGAIGPTDSSNLLVSTGVDGEPWDIFTGNIAAIYYL